MENSDIVSNRGYITVHNILDVMSKDYIDIPEGAIKWYELSKKFHIAMIKKDIAKAIEVINEEHLWFKLYPYFVVLKNSLNVLMIYKMPKDDIKDDHSYSGIYTFNGSNKLNTSYGKCKFYNAVCRPHTGFILEEYG